MADNNQNLLELTNPSAIKSIVVPSDLTSLPAILAYYQRFLEPFRSSFPGVSERRTLSLIFKNASGVVDKRSGIDFNQNNRLLPFGEQTKDNSYLYPTDLANILNQIYEHLQILLQATGELKLDSFSISLLGLFEEKINGNFAGYKESNLYDSPSAKSTLEKQIQELLQTLNANLITGSDVVLSSLVDDYGAVESQNPNNLLQFLKAIALPLLDAIIEVPLQAETSNDELKQQVSFNKKVYSLTEAKEFINELVVLINHSLTLDKPKNEQLSKLREKISTSDEFFAKNAQLIQKLAPSEKRLAYMRVSGSNKDSSREFITLNESHLFFTPVDAPMTADDRKNAELLKVLWNSLLELTSKDLKPEEETSQAEQEKDADVGGVEETNLGEEITYSQLLSLFAITAADQIFQDIWNSSQINLQTRINTWLNQNGYGDINQLQLQTYLSQNLVQLVKSTFDELARQDSSSAAAQLQRSEISFYNSSKNVYVLNQAYVEWFQQAYSEIVQPVTELFLSDDFENKTLPAYVVLQVSPDLENTETSTSLDSLATAGTPDQDTLAKLLEEYQASQGQSPTRIADWARELSSLKAGNPQAYNQFIGKIITPQSRLHAELFARMEQSVLLQLQRNGLFDVRDLSAIPDNFLVELRNDISEYLLSLPPEKLLAALADPTARLQLLSEFNRRYLLRQVSSAQIINSYILIRQVEALNTAETEIDSLVEALADSKNSLTQKDEIKKRLHALIIASGYTPSNAELSTLDQKQIELLFNISFGNKKLSQAELNAFRNALQNYTDGYYFANQLDKEVSLSQAINDQFSGNNTKFEQEKLSLLTEITTTINSFTNGTISVLATDIENSITSFISTSSITSSSEFETLSKQDITDIILLSVGLNKNGDFDREALENLLLKLDENQVSILKELIIEYTQKFIPSFAENRAVYYITRPISAGSAPSEKLSTPSGEDADKDSSKDSGEVARKDAEDQFSGNNTKFEQEKLRLLTKITTTINSFTNGTISVLATEDIENSITSFISTSSITSSSEFEALSKQDITDIILLSVGLNKNGDFDRKNLENLLLELDENQVSILKKLIIEYTQKFIPFAENKNKAVSYIPRPISAGSAPSKKLSTLSGEDAENYGLLLSSLGEDLPERTRLTDIEKIRRDFAWQAYLESLKNQRVAIENGDLLPYPWQWEVPLEEIYEYSSLFPELQQRAILEKKAIAKLQQQQLLQQQQQEPTLASVLEAAIIASAGKRRLTLPLRKEDKKKKKLRIKQAIQNKIQRRVVQKTALMVTQAIAKLLAFAVQVALPAIVSGGLAIVGAIIGSPILLGVALGTGIYAGLNFFFPGWQASISSFFSGIGSGLQSFFAGIGSGLQSLGSTIAAGLQSAANSILGFGQSLVTGFAKGVLSAIEGFFQSLGSGILSNLAIPTFSVLGAVVVPVAVMHTIDSGRYAISTQVDDVEESSEYLDITKEVTPSIVSNGQVVDLQYTISLRAKGSYTIALDVASAKDEFTITSGKVNIELPDQTATVQSQLASVTVGAEPVIITYTIPGVSGTDAMINNLFSLNFTASGGDLAEPVSESFRARASVTIGSPELGCFIFADETGPSNRDPVGYNRIKAEGRGSEGTPIVMKNWTKEESNEVLRAFANRMGNYDAFVTNLCKGQPISVYRITGRSWGGWALSKNAIGLYDAAFSRFSALEYTLAHELGHLYDYRNSGIEREFTQKVGSRCPITYPLDTCPRGEPFAESIALFIVWETANFGERHGKKVGKFNFPVELPVHYQFVKEKVFQAN